MSAHPSTAAVVATDLVKTYPAGRGAPPVRALDGLSVSAAAGAVFALLGPNGAGKSTTVKVLATLARADAGTAVVAGIDLNRDPDAVRRRIGLVAQKPSHDPMATGRENITLAGRIQGLSRADARRRAGELLERFGLADAAGRLARTYSGGMGRRLDVAIGLVHRPQVLFLDEPTSGLDPEARAQMWEEIDRLGRDEQVTTILTTHYLDEADRLAARLAIVDAGRVVVEGPPDDLKRELHGDTVRVELHDVAPPGARVALTRVRGLHDVVVDGRAVRARADDGGHAVPEVLAALAAADVPVASVQVARPSLDEVYLRHVGRRLEVAA